MFSTIDIFNDTKIKLKNNYLKYCVVTLFVCGFSMIVNLLLSLTTLSYLASSLLSILLLCPIVIYVYIFDLNIAKGKSNIYPNIKTVLMKSFKSTLIMLMVVVATYVGLLLLIIPGVYIMILLSQSFYILADRDDVDSTDCLTESIELMKGNVLNYVLLQLQFIPYLLLSTITCGIYLYWAIPKIQVARANFYLYLKNKDV